MKYHLDGVDKTKINLSSCIVSPGDILSPSCRDKARSRVRRQRGNVIMRCGWLAHCCLRFGGFLGCGSGHHLGIGLIGVFVMFSCGLGNVWWQSGHTLSGHIGTQVYG